MVLDTELTDDAARRGRCARARPRRSRNCGARPSSSSTIASSCGSRAYRYRSPRYLPQVADDTLAELRDGDDPGRRAPGDRRAGWGSRHDRPSEAGLSAMTARAARAATRGRARWPIFIGLAATVFIARPAHEGVAGLHVVPGRAAPGRRRLHSPDPLAEHRRALRALPRSGPVLRGRLGRRRGRDRLVPPQLRPEHAAVRRARAAPRRRSRQHGRPVPASATSSTSSMSASAISGSTPSTSPIRRSASPSSCC